MEETTDPVTLLLVQVVVDFAEACTEALVIRYLFQNFLCSLPAVVASNDLKVVLREVAQQSFIGNIGLDVDDQRLVSGCWFLLHGSPENRNKDTVKASNIPSRGGRNKISCWHMDNVLGN